MPRNGTGTGPDNPVGYSPGYYLGPPQRPSQYRLERCLGTFGEGTVWRAISPVDGVDEPWAVKIVLQDELEARTGEPGESALREAAATWSATQLRTARMNDPAVVPAVDVFVGPVPHLRPDPPRRAAQALYLVTAWVEGPDLKAWRQSRAGGQPPAGRAGVGQGGVESEGMPQIGIEDVVTQLCEILDRFAAAGWVHRDLSPGNVLIEHGRTVRLIDFALAGRAGGPVTHYVGTCGYLAPEADSRLLDGRPPSVEPANDRYSLGAITYWLLTGDTPPPIAARRYVRERLSQDGYRTALALQVSALLHEDPRRRPELLTPWAQEFRRNLQPDSGHRYLDCALATDGHLGATLITAGPEHVATMDVSAGNYLLLRPQADGPRGAQAVAAARRGDGRLAMFVRDEGYRLHARGPEGWSLVPGLRARGWIHAVARSDGAAVAYAAATDTRLVEITQPLRGALEVTVHDLPVRQVHAAVAGPQGPVVVVQDDQDDVLWGTPQALRPVGIRGAELNGAEGLAACMDDHRELVCLAATGQDRLQVLTNAAGRPADRQERRAPFDATSVACCWLRSGLALAVGSAAGLAVSTPEHHEWVTVWERPVTRVVLGTGAGWILQAAALSDGELVHVDEMAPGLWTPTGAGRITSRCS